MKNWDAKTPKKRRGVTDGVTRDVDSGGGCVRELLNVSRAAASHRGTWLDHPPRQPVVGRHSASIMPDQPRSIYALQKHFLTLYAARILNLLFRLQPTTFDVPAARTSSQTDPKLPCHPGPFLLSISVLMAALCNRAGRADHYIFALRFLLSFFFLLFFLA